MKNILLIDTNTTPFNEAFPVYPTGLDYLQGELIKRGYENTEILDLTRVGGPLTSGDFTARTKKSLELIEREVSEKHWDVIGLSLRNIDSTYPSMEGDPDLHYYLPALLEYIACVEKNAAQDAFVVLGGTAFSMMPDMFLKGKPAAFHGVVGPGETAFPDMVDDLLAGKEAPGIVNGHPDVMGRLQNRGLIRKYFGVPLSESTFGIRTKVGCGQSCGYCPYPLINGPKQFFKDPAVIMEEIGLLREIHEQSKSRQPLQLMFADDIFNRPLDHAKEVLKSMLDRSLGIDSWHAYLDPKNIDREFMELVFQTSGWTRFVQPPDRGAPPRKVMFFPFDIESGSPKMLKNLRKPYTVEDILASAKVFKDVAQKYEGKDGLLSTQCGFHILLGYPGEDEESIKETCMAINEARPDQIAIQLGVRIYPGTPLSRETKGKLWHKEEDLFKPVFTSLDGNDVVHWLREYLDDSYTRLNQKGNMLLIM